MEPTLRTITLTGEDAKIAFHYLSWVEEHINEVWESEDWDELLERGVSTFTEEAPVRGAYASTALELWDIQNLGEYPEKLKVMQRVVRTITRDKILVNQRGDKGASGGSYFAMPGPAWFSWINWIMKNEDEFREGNETRAGVSRRGRKGGDEKPIRLQKAVVSTPENPVDMESWKRMMKSFRAGHLYFIVCDSRMKIPSKAITWDQHVAMMSVDNDE